MNKTSSSPNQSFFDCPEVDVTTFWKQIDDSDFSNYPLEMEGTFYFRTRKLFKEQASCILSLRSTFLIFKKKKHDTNVDYIDFEEYMYRLHIIGPTDKRYSNKYKYAFALTAQGKSTEFYCKDKAQFQLWISHFKKFCLFTNFNEVYLKLEVIGTGGYGKVYLLEDMVTKAKWAGKFIKLSPSKSIKRQQVMVMNEIKILRKVNHSNIVKLLEIYEVDAEICMVMEYIEGEKLFNYIIKNKRLAEVETASIMKQLLLSIHHMQLNDIIHRDIKPENILLVPDGVDKFKVKVIDFGLGTFNKHRDIIKKCGTAGYVAPEILNSDPYDFSADLYSAAIVLMVCLTGKPGFQAKDYHELLEKNKNNILRTKGKRWNKLSQEARNLIQNLTESEPGLRMSLIEALNHEWFQLQLPSEERKDIPELIFPYIKMTVPQEGKVSQMPFVSSQFPILNKLPSNSFFDNSNASQSFITSRNHLVGKSITSLNSFYKSYTRESSISSEPSIINSPDQFLSKSFQKKQSAKDNVLFLPNQRLSHDPKTVGGQRRSISLQSTPRKELITLRSAAATYKIQVSSIAATSIEMMSSDDEMSCGMRYMKLTKNSFVVKKTNLS